MTLKEKIEEIYKPCCFPDQIEEIEKLRIPQRFAEWIAKNGLIKLTTNEWYVHYILDTKTTDELYEKFLNETEA